MLDPLLHSLSLLRARFESRLLKRRWSRLRAMGMHIGQGVNLPASTWIDVPTCYLIGIGDWCGFGPQCVILSHDALMDEFLDAGLLGRVVIHESCHFGCRTVILGGVEIGPRTIVGANSVVAQSLPPDSVCAGVPAKVICTLDEYLARHRENMAKGRLFPWTEYGAGTLTPERRQELLQALADGPVYLTGGFSEELKGRGGIQRTPYDQTALPHGLQRFKNAR